LDGVNLSRDAARIAPGDGVDGRWLTLALKSELAQEQFRRREVGATITGINIEDLKSVRLPIPPRDEQDRQATKLDQSSKKYVGLVHLLESQIDLLVEHRQALITAAVTGELHIPGVAA
jgi:type I restriction enzyme S subunit